MVFNGFQFAIFFAIVSRRSKLAAACCELLLLWMLGHSVSQSNRDLDRRGLLLRYGP
jgi:hypothetical protein